MKSSNLKYFVMGAIVAAGLWGEAVTIPNTFSAGEALSAAKLNANFSALGTAVTALEANGSVSTARLADNAVTIDKMADGAVGTSEVVNSAIVNSKLADFSVTSVKIADGEVGTNDLASNAVNGAKIADGSVATADIQNGAVNASKTLDEPGVGQEIEGPQTLSIADSDIAVVNAELTVPGSGFVMAVASGVLAINHVTGTGSQVFIDITNNSDPASSNARISTVLPQQLPSATYENPYSVQKIYRVNAAGNVNISVRAIRQFGFGGSVSGRLSLVYFPTSYGFFE
jgi:hypothetical protein